MQQGICGEFHACHRVLTQRMLGASSWAHSSAKGACSRGVVLDASQMFMLIKLTLQPSLAPLCSARRLFEMWVNYAICRVTDKKAAGGWFFAQGEVLVPVPHPSEAIEMCVGGGAAGCLM